MDLLGKYNHFEPAFKCIKLDSDESDTQQAGSSAQGWRHVQVIPDRTPCAFFGNYARQIKENPGAHQRKDFAIRDAQLPKASETTASSPEEDDGTPVYVGDSRSATIAGDPADEFGTLIVGVDHVKSEVSDADNPVRENQLGIPIATSDQVVVTVVQRRGEI